MCRPLDNWRWYDTIFRLRTGKALGRNKMNRMEVAVHFRPAVTIARMFSDTFAGIEPASVPMFLIAQIVGGAVGYGLARTIYRQPTLTALTNENRHELDATRRFETSADDFQARITALLRDLNV
jgi:glycerol uptake facilitator-like aquaporin